MVATLRATAAATAAEAAAAANLRTRRGTRWNCGYVATAAATSKGGHSPGPIALRYRTGAELDTAYFAESLFHALG